MLGSCMDIQVIGQTDGPESEFCTIFQVERFSAEVQVTEARCFYGFQIAIEVGPE